MTVYTTIHRIKSVVLEDAEPICGKDDIAHTRRMTITHENGTKTDITLFGTKEVLNF